MENEERMKVTQLDVERINIVDKQGKVRMVLSSPELSPKPVVAGQTLGGRDNEPSAGILFYNEDGDECGGLTFANKSIGLCFDQYQQDQIVVLRYDESELGKTYGLQITDVPDLTLPQWLDLIRPVIRMEDDAERSRAWEELRDKGLLRADRIFVGKNTDGDATVTVADSKGRSRIRMRVDANDVPKIEILDADGNVTFSLPPEI